jgi:hypothetical protein
MTFTVHIYLYPKIDYSPNFFKKFFIYFCPPQNKAFLIVEMLKIPPI